MKPSQKMYWVHKQSHWWSNCLRTALAVIFKNGIQASLYLGNLDDPSNHACVCLKTLVSALYESFLTIQLPPLLPVTLRDSSWAAVQSRDSSRKQGRNEGRTWIGTEPSLRKHGGDSYLTGNNLY